MTETITTNVARPIFVDLDDSLVATDTLLESLLAVLRDHPWRVPSLLWRLLQSRALGKRDIARNAAITDASLLPYRGELVSYLREQRELGRPVVLATAADRSIATAVSQHLGCFDDVLASDGAENLKGKAKLQAIRKWCEGNGYADFAYVGDSRADVPIWEAAAEVLAVSPSTRLTAELKAQGLDPQVFQDQQEGLSGISRVLRPYQWIKNILLFAPLVLAHQLHETALAAQASVAFVVFCMCSSATYIFNDLLDLPFDRQHPTKSSRPIAAGRLRIEQALMMMGALLIAALGLSLVFLPPPFLGWAALYVGATTAYSLGLKRLVVVDVIMLAGFYTLRLLAGGQAVQVEVSEWLFAFSAFLFMSLALVKRYAELSRTAAAGLSDAPPGRGYDPSDLQVLGTVGPTSGYLAALVMALYINSDPVRQLYQRPEWLWLICALITYWITRVWILVRRGQMSEDPVLFALRDKASWATAAIAVVIMFLATAR